MRIRINHKTIPAPKDDKVLSKEVDTHKKKAKSFLTRTLRSGEVIKIGEDIALLLKRIKDNRAEISIMAPKNMKIIYEGKV